MSAVKNIHSISEVMGCETEWLWYPYIAYGKVTIIMGDPGEGKTTLALNIAAAVSSGKAFWKEEGIPVSDVVFQTAEDGLSDTVKPRLLAAGADCNRVFFYDDSEDIITFTDERIPEILSFTGCRLMIFDPLQAFLGQGVDMHRANEIRPVMSRLASLAAEFNCAIVLIGHMNKNMTAKAAYRAVGSIDLTAAARSVLIVARDKSAPEVRVISQIKSSLAPEGKNVAFRLSEDNGLSYIGEYESDIDELLLGIGSAPTKRDLAKEFLMSELGNGQPKLAKLITDKAAALDISSSSLSRAKSQLGVKSFKKDNVWFVQI